MECCYQLMVDEKPARDAAEAIRRLVSPEPGPAGSEDSRARATLGSVKDLSSTSFKTFMAHLNTIAEANQLSTYVSNWSKVWEYPWLWFNGLGRVEWQGKRLLDVGSGKSPMPWLIAMLGAEVTIAERLRDSIPVWEKIRDQYQFKVDWVIVPGDDLPFPDSRFDVVTSFSVIEHQKDKPRAVSESTRVLKPNGLFALSFDLCEEQWGMTYPNRLGKALTVKEFEELVWHSPALDTEGAPLNWTTDQCAEFLRWHWDGNPDSRYVVGAASIRKKQTTSS
jgi:SAM-dependent methyltransferase